MIDLFKPCLGDEELRAVSDVFRSGWLGAGKKVEGLIEKFSYKIGASQRHLLTLSSCTDGLFMAMELCDVYNADVVMPTIHFVGAANAVWAAGGVPVFCDVDPVTLNPTVGHIDAVVTHRTKAVCILHYGGRPCDDIENIASYCNDRGIYLIEDSACSLDSYYNGKACGMFGDIGLWSFDPMKLLSCGDGGMMHIRTTKMVERAKKLAFFGLSKKSGLISSQTSNSRWWEFEVEEAGRYSSMNDITAAIMLKQLESLPDFKKQRATVDSIYRRCLEKIEGLSICPKIQLTGVHSHYFFWIQTPYRDELAVYLKDHGVYTTFRYYPLHKVSYYGLPTRQYPGAEEASETTLLLPIHAALTVNDVVDICTKISEFFDERIQKV